MQPTLSLWEDEADTVEGGPLQDPARHHSGRIVADSHDRVAWLRARSRGITATDVARLSGPAAVRGVVMEKLLGSGFTGNAFTDHGRAREPVIARWVERNHSILPSSKLFHALGDVRHLATPDGVGQRGSGEVVLAEIKTTAKAWRSIPKNYLRQVWWQQYVLGAERTLVVWEQHVDFVPLPGPPRCQWVERDETAIHQLVQLADAVLAEISYEAP